MSGIPEEYTNFVPRYHPYNPNMKIENRRLLRRYLLFVVALFINAFGIALITKALLGTSPITSVTYVLSMFTPMTMGQWTIVLNLLFMLLELPFMTREDLKTDRRIFLLQIPVTLFFGAFIDCSMEALCWLAPQAYPAKIFSLLVGCVVLAVGIALEVKANVAMAAGEYFVRAISRRIRGEFGYVKLGFDITLVLLACALSLGFMSGIYGVREGTVIAALIVGPIVHFVTPFYRFLDGWIGEPGPHSRPEPEAADAEIRRVNRNRRTHYEYYTGERWGDPHRYDLTINTGRMSLDDAAAAVARIYGERIAAVAGASGSLPNGKTAAEPADRKGRTGC